MTSLFPRLNRLLFLIESLPITCRTESCNNKAFITLKLDVSKAYDRVEWKFLQMLLLRLGVPLNFVDLLNGYQFGHLVPERGLRQGDPLSRYLFICVVEAFIVLLYQEKREGRIYQGDPPSLLCR